MLQFFRNYQKFFFGIIAVVVIMSFSFFDSYGVMQGDGGQARELREDEALTRLMANNGKVPNFLHGHLFQNEWIEAGLVAQVAQVHFDEIREDVAERLDKIKRYRPYVHPQAPFLSAMTIWGHFAPELADHLKEIKEKEVSPAAFGALLQLYMDQVACPPELVRHILQYQQSSCGDVIPDPALAQGDLALAGLHGEAEWFGDKLVSLVIHEVLEGAAIAEEKGIRVSWEEARADLVRNLYEGLSREQKDLTPELAASYFPQQLHLLGLEERQAIKAWQKALLFKKYMDGVDKEISIDPTPYQQRARFNGETVDVVAYKLPQELRLSTFLELQKFQYYLEAACGASSKSLALPEQFLSLEQIEKKHPELIEKVYTVEVASASKSALENRISLKETWEWEMDEAHWKELKKEFSSVASMLSATREERFIGLEQIDAKERLKIDEFARNRIINDHPEWMQEELAKAELRPMSLKIRLKGGTLPLEGIGSPQTLAGLLDAGDVASYSGDGKHFYRIVLKEKPSEKTRVALGEVLMDGTFDEIAGKKQVADLIKAIEKDYVQAGRALPEEPTTDFYASRRLFHFMKAQNEALALGAAPQGLWPLEKKEMQIQRKERGFFDSEELFSRTVGDWSTVAVKDTGEMGFFHLVDRKQGQLSYEEELQKDREALIAEAKKKWVQELVPVIEERLQQRNKV